MHDITLYKGFHTSSTNMTDWKITIFKHEMYIFIHVFHCHVSFRGGISCHTTMTHYYGCDMAVSQEVLKISSSFFLILKLMYLLLDIWEGHWFEFEVPISVGSTTQLPQAANYLLAQALAISSFKLGSKNMFLLWGKSWRWNFLWKKKSSLGAGGDISGEEKSHPGGLNAIYIPNLLPTANQGEWRFFQREKFICYFLKWPRVKRLFQGV